MADNRVTSLCSSCDNINKCGCTGRVSVTQCRVYPEGKVKMLEGVITDIIGANRLRNDMDAYLFQLCRWAIEGGCRPDPEEYGVTSVVQRRSIGDMLEELREEVNQTVFATEPDKDTPKRIRITCDLYESTGHWTSDKQHVHDHIKRLNDGYGHKYRFEIEG